LPPAPQLGAQPLAVSAARRIPPREAPAACRGGADRTAARASGADGRDGTIRCGRRWQPPSLAVEPTRRWLWGTVVAMELPRRARAVVEAWVERFNAADIDGLAALYHEDAVNHQVMNEPVEGR